MYDIYDSDKWAKYDEDDREYYAMKARAKSKWEARKVVLDKHSTYGKVR